MNKQEIYNQTEKTLTIGVWNINLQDNTISWDAITKSFFEVSDDFVPDYKNTLAFFNRKNLIEFKILIKKTIENKIPIHGKFQIITAKNNIKYLECICQVDRTNNHFNRVQGTFRDITTEEERISELESAAEKYASVFSSANDAIVIIDTETLNITDCNSRTYELTGYKDTEIIGVHNSLFFPEDKREEIQFYLKEKIKQNTNFIK